MLNPRNLANGQEQYETFRSNITRKTAVQYDYRHTDGRFFSCVKSTLEACRQARENWIKKDDITTQNTKGEMDNHRSRDWKPQRESSSGAELDPGHSKGLPGNKNAGISEGQPGGNLGRRSDPRMA